MESLVTVVSTSKEDTYKEILPQIQALASNETDLVANLANTTSALKLAFESISWVGFYLLKDGGLVLGPFQGKPACVRIALGNGVCGSSAASKQTIIVPNVHEYPGHIVCDPESKSEIVVPILKNNNILGVLDVDSASFGTFNEIDKQYLEELCNWLSKNVF